jgi:hypothetical protein
MATLTLKQVPDQLYQRLKQRHRRSLNNEAIVCLEEILEPQHSDSRPGLEEIRALRRETASWRARRPGRPTVLKGRRGDFVTTGGRVARGPSDREDADPALWRTVFTRSLLAPQTW